MRQTPKSYIIEASALPEIFKKVLETKSLLQKNRVRTVNEAVAITGISRSAYYKYRDAITPLNDLTNENIITVYGVLNDEPGVLSNLLNLFARSGANILTINQNIPLNSIANITITMQTSSLRLKLDTLLDKAAKQKGIIRLEIISG